MSTKPRHIIRKLAIDLHCPGPETGRAMYDQLGDVLLHRVEPELEALFDRLGDIRLNKLELDLGVLPAKNWEAVLRERLLEQCAQSLNELVNPKANSKPQTSKQGAAHPIFETYIFFLQTGRLPWWAEHRQLQELETALLQARVLDDPTATDALIALLNTHPDALPRLLSQTGTSLLEALWECLAKRQKGQTGRSTGIKTPDWQQVGTSNAARQAALKAFAALIKSEINPADEMPEKTRLKRQTDKPPETDQAVFVINAGLVLLHPFLSPFFQQLGLVEKNGFPGKAEQELAVQWLHFLATGSLECPEPELVLPKILCNMPAEHPVSRWFTPNDEQIAEVENLLSSAIAHWSALKSTKPDGLREGFLQRTGKLESRADGTYKLTVERLAQDVLLEQLPWNIGMLRLPWMEQILFVEW